MEKTVQKNDVTFKRQSQWKEVWRRFRKSKGSVIGLILLTIIALMLIFAEQIAPYENAITQDFSCYLAKPSAEHMFIHKTHQSKAEIFSQAAKLMDQVGLARRYANSYPHELDGGRRQRIGIARALSLNPKFIVCDEPVSALDVSIQAQILNLLMDLQAERGLAYMFVTHDLSVVKHISDNIMVMYLGQCVEVGPSDELFKNPLHPYTKALLAAIPRPDIRMRDKEFELIHGEVSSPINVKPGCRFAARCPCACDTCRTADPSLTEVTPGHFAACSLLLRD